MKFWFSKIQVCLFSYTSSLPLFFKSILLSPHLSTTRTGYNKFQFKLYVILILENPGVFIYLNIIPLF